jgi:PD-(D/E)XK endonuclease
MTDGVLIPWIFACADPCAGWWERLRGNPKRSGEISQAAFLLKAETMGFDVALPWGDNQKFDFVVWRGNGRALRVQVKGTGRLHRRGYEVQPVHATRRGGKKRYSKKDIDLIAAHVQPVDAWYLIPVEKVGRAKSLRLYPGLRGGARLGSVETLHMLDGPAEFGTGSGGAIGGTCWDRASSLIAVGYLRRRFASVQVEHSALPRRVPHPFALFAKGWDSPPLTSWDFCPRLLRFQYSQLRAVRRETALHSPQPGKSRIMREP